MQIGKLSIKDLKEVIFRYIKRNRKEVITTPEIGGDCAVIETNGDEVIYLSSDPITGATSSLGKLAININANDIATSGIAPLGVMLTILAPPQTTKEELEKIMQEAQQECDILNMEILGGHTEITDGVNRIIMSVTAIGLGKKSDLKKKDKVKNGDIIILTKGAGIEGTGIIASEKKNEISKEFGTEFLERAIGYLEKTSVVKEGIIGNKLTKGMHDATEGGVFGALWEMCELYSLGCEVYEERIKIGEETKKISDFYEINPLKLISSGSMVMIVSYENVKILLKKLDEEGIEACEIGVLTDKQEKIFIKKDIKIEINAPESDELYKVI